MEVLEDRTLLTGDIRGTVWNDLNGDGIRNTGELGLVGWTTFLDMNNNGVLNQDPDHFFATAVPVYLADNDPYFASLAVTGAGPVVGSFTITITLTPSPGQSGPLDVALRSPSGRFRPTGRLADFAGENSNGTWVLDVADKHSFPNVLSAELQSWSLSISAGPAEPTCQ